MPTNTSSILELYSINLQLVRSQLISAKSALTSSESHLANADSELIRLTKDQIGHDGSSRINHARIRWREAYDRTDKLRKHVEEMRLDCKRLQAAVCTQIYLDSFQQSDEQNLATVETARQMGSFSIFKRGWERNAGVRLAFLLQRLKPKGEASGILMLRQATSMFALCVTYLVFYLVDVQLQIAYLPAIEKLTSIATASM